MNSPGPDAQRFVIVPHRPHLRGWLLLAGSVWLLSIIGIGWWAMQHAVPELAVVRQQLSKSERELARQTRESDELKQQAATLKRSDQISRSANIELQATLAEREEQLSGLRADVDFYERLVGSTGKRHGLSVHEVIFTPETGGTWQYTITLTQNINRGGITTGQMRLTIDGVRNGKLAAVKWDELVQKPAASGQPFSFRYFQQIEGSVMLPAGFTPQRVRVNLNAQGSTVDQAFDWSASRKQGEK